MVDNAGDDLVDRKPRFVDYFVEIKPPKVEASVKVEAPMKVEALHINFVFIKRSCAIMNPMLELVCERSDEQKVQKKKLKHEATRSRKWGCLFKVRGYVVKEENTWNSAILNGVHNHKMLPYLAGHILAERLMKDDKEIICDLTKSSAKQKNILTNLKKKIKESMTNIKQVYNERHNLKKAQRGNMTEMQYQIPKLEENKCDNDIIQDIFWTHPQSVKLFNNFLTF
ncbi:hypothetical protein MTR_3g462670 [Medicago truncatula]|uniref:Uncharacterized protein n=1 Tax=Medicago truncatula TaxID=3880 RepID=A0A072UXK4_MEDTR|nr:hypothetical protein MTR_3g462670 [Medicago truncatula]